VKVEEVPEKLEEGIQGSVKVTNGVTREGRSDGVWKFDGIVVPW